jgi:NAD(P)-dependent dehydrogenase (short-subunit alcohol dehydrogenase family)
MTIDLRGKPIAITGASSGIGRATALACAAAGMPVVVGARRLPHLESLVAAIRAQGGRAEAIACDVDNPADGERLVARTVESFGSIYSVFANAGYGLEGAAMDLTDEQYEAIIRTNFFGTLRTIRPALPYFRKAGGGHVLICSSCVSKMGLPYHGAYSASKALQDHVGRAMRLELAPEGILVSTIHPIGVCTEFSERVSEKAGGERRAVRTPESMKQPPELIADFIVRCLRKPRGEVWTHTPTRLGMGVLTIFPGLADWYLARRLRRQGRQGSERGR